tara:strand:- start:1054 stop:1299 length:246 start_codon:yes stop_codon:yes gene_type:complete
MNRSFIRNNITSISILIFITLFILVQYLQPAFLYDRDGALREFGLGKKNKTILPIWLISLILAIFSYLFVLYYLTMPKFTY